jgi:hypothetical protein
MYIIMLLFNNNMSLTDEISIEQEEIENIIEIDDDEEISSTEELQNLKEQEQFAQPPKPIDKNEVLPENIETAILQAMLIFAQNNGLDLYMRTHMSQGELKQYQAATNIANITTNSLQPLTEATMSNSAITVTSGGMNVVAGAGIMAVGEATKNIDNTVAGWTNENELAWRSIKNHIIEDFSEHPQHLLEAFIDKCKRELSIHKLDIIDQFQARNKKMIVEEIAKYCIEKKWQETLLDQSWRDRKSVV